MIDRNKLSTNEVYVSGILNELEITEGKTKDGRDYVRGMASVRVDQEINGVLTENVIPVRMFSMKKKSDGSESALYNRIVGYKDQFTSLAAAENEEDASAITITAGSFDENAWFDTKSNMVRSNFQISANFINKKKDADIEAAKFNLSGVVGKIRPEINRDGEETGRIIIDFILLNWGGKAHKIELIAQGSAKDFIEDNWNQQDTVNVTGRINMTYKTETYEEPQGFGEPIIRTRTISTRELLITGGSPSGLEEALSYDADSIKQALADRATDHEALKTAAKTKTNSTSAKKPVDFGF